MPTSRFTGAEPVGSEREVSISALQINRLEALLGRILLTKIISRAHARHDIDLAGPLSVPRADEDTYWLQWTPSKLFPDDLLARLMEAVPSDALDVNLSRICVEDVADRLIRAWYKDKGIHPLAAAFARL